MAVVQSGSKLVTRYFTKDGGDVFGDLKWGKRRAYLYDMKEEKALMDLEVEAPDNWSDTAVNIAAYKYFYKTGLPTPEGRELSVKQMVERVANAITHAGEDLGYFDNLEESKVFKDELRYLLVNQKAAFNSPVWFNVGIWHSYGISRPSHNYYFNTKIGQVESVENAYEYPQCSGCFIQSVKDDLEGIFELIKRESRLFKNGSGTGSNFSALRSKYENLSTGGTSSGLLSFLKVFDSGAAATKSGGTTRRAAKMAILDIDHPEVEDFIKWKAKEEDKALALIKQGYDADFNGEAYSTIAGQNSNNSVRVTDDFMRAYLNDDSWSTKFRTTGEVHKSYKARDLMRMISESAWRCADPGMQYDTTINRWHTSKTSGRINGSNPCSEYMFLDDTSCNLASINLVGFDKNGEFDIEGFRRAIDIIILAQDIIIDFASYPYEEVTLNSHNFRPLGIGFANLGAYLMRNGHPYDSDKGRGISASITAILTGHSYLMSTRIAERLGSFVEYKKNEADMRNVIKMHKIAADNIEHSPEALHEAAVEDWRMAEEMGMKHGFRNAQVSVLAPTGTIGPLMDVDTTGVEPDFALVKYKSLAGGGGYSIVNQSVPTALTNLGYAKEQVEEINQYILDNGKIEDAPHIKDEHLAIFDCANKCSDGERYIRPMAHIDMMAAVQPFLSGAISKTVNMPNEATVEEIEDIYITGWKKGLKALAVYRDGSKSSQPLTTDKKDDSGVLQVEVKKKVMPRTREGLTHKFSIANTHKIYITANKFEDGELGELFLTAGKEGSVVSGLLGTIARLCSKMLQEGAAPESIIDSLVNLRFDPWGMTDNPDIPMAKSIPDYIGRWLGRNFLKLDKQVMLGIADGQVEKKTVIDEELEEVEAKKGEIEKTEEEVEQPVLSLNSEEISKQNGAKYAPVCHTCGALMVRNGTCFSCKECGSTTGCS